MLFFGYFILLFFEFGMGDENWSQKGKNSHLNGRSDISPKENEWKRDFNGFVFNGELIFNEKNNSMILTVSEVNGDKLDEYIYEISLDNGEDISKTYVKSSTEEENDVSYGGFYEDSKYFFVKGAMRGDLHSFDVKSKEISKWNIEILDPLNMPFLVFRENVIYKNYSQKDCGVGVSQCYQLISHQYLGEKVNWKSMFFPDDCRASQLTVDDDGYIYLMSDSCGERNNDIYIVNTKNGNHTKISIPDGTRDAASIISVSNIKEVGNYYFNQVSRGDKKTYLYAFSKEKNEMIWKKRISGTEFQSCSGPVISSDGKKLNVACPGFLSSTLYLFDNTGKEIKSKTVVEAGCIFSSIFDNGHQVYTCANMAIQERKVLVYDKDLRQVHGWKFKKMEIEQPPVIDSGNNVYFCLTDYKTASCYKRNV